MGSANNSHNRMQEFTLERTQGSISVLSKKEKHEEKYLMKTYTASSKEELAAKMRFFTDYKAKMEENQELTKLVEIVEEKDEYFCSSSHKLHLIFEYSDLHIGRQIKVRRDSMRRVIKRSDPSQNKYFSYEDLCNILYSCLSALWFNKELLAENPDCELKKFGTIFLSSQNILIFGSGTLKIMDPFINDFNHRYNFTPNIYYSPQKLTNFCMTDDEKCAIFELGMTLLQISLLEGMSDAYSGYEYRDEVTANKLKKAREVYASQIENSLTVSVFDLLQKMLERDRQERFNLEQAIEYAEQMYEVQESFAQQISPSNPHKFYDQSGSNKKQRRTNHSSSPRKTSINKFNDFKNSTVCGRDSMLQSPKISNFTIHEVQAEREENSSMLESVKVDNLRREGEVNQSLIQGSVFSAVNIADSYVYGNHYLNTYKFGSSIKEEKIFTDPDLMNTIYRQLREIEQRKRFRNKDDSIFCSKVEERRDRYQFYEQASAGMKITNRAYLA